MNDKGKYDKCDQLDMEMSALLRPLNKAERQVTERWLSLIYTRKELLGK